jgi:hypothetical protein
LKTLFALLIAAATLCGQDNNKNNSIKKLSLTEASLAWAAVSFPTPADLPPITDGGLPVELQANDGGIRVVMTYRQPGQYLLELERCNGQKDKLDEFQIDPSPQLYTNFDVVYDSEMARQGLRGFGCVSFIRLFRVYAGSIQGAEVNLDRWNDETPKYPVKNESVNGESYTLTFDTLPADATVILGRNMLGKIKPALGGSAVSFERSWVPNRRPITVTVCSKNRCSSTTHEPKNLSKGIDAVSPVGSGSTGSVGSSGGGGTGGQQ